MESVISTMEQMMADAINTVDPMDDVYLANAIIQANKNARFPGYGMAVTSGLLKARDAAIRAESAELLRVCGEALDETTRQLEAMNRSVAHAASWIEPISNSTTVRIHKNKATLAALKKAGVME